MASLRVKSMRRSQRLPRGPHRAADWGRSTSSTNPTSRPLGPSRLRGPVVSSTDTGFRNTVLVAAIAATLHGDVLAVHNLTPWPRDPGTNEDSNRETIGRLGAVEDASLASVERAEPELLRRAGRSLPIARWLDGAR